MDLHASFSGCVPRCIDVCASTIAASPCYITNSGNPGITGRCDHSCTPLSCLNQDPDQDLQCVDLTNYLYTSNGVLTENAGENIDSLQSCHAWEGHGGNWLQNYEVDCDGYLSTLLCAAGTYGLEPSCLECAAGSFCPAGSRENGLGPCDSAAW